MNDKLPEVIYAVHNGLGETLFFSNLRKCPVTYDDKIEISIYHLDGTKILKRSYEVLEISSSSNVDEVK